MEMGHGDELIISDGNFPRIGYPEHVVRLDGHGIPEILEALLELMPLDTFEPAVTLMEIVKGDTYDPSIWNQYKRILSDKGYTGEYVHLERYEFYKRAKQTYVVITTSEMSLYANIILKKGIVNL